MSGEIGLSVWLNMTLEEQREHLLAAEKEKARDLQSLSVEASLRMGFELMELQKDFPMTCRHAPVALSTILR